MHFLSNPVSIFIAGFLVFLLIFFIPLMPAVFVFSYDGDGLYIEGSPPSGSIYASREGAIVPDGEFLWPLPGINKRGWGFGWRFHPIKHKWAMHNGVDIGAAEGTNIIAVEDGIVAFAGNKGGYGKAVIIDHGDSVESLYGHCSKLLVKDNQDVRKGDIIAKVGNTGLSTDPHLHFEIRINNVATNPLPYISSGHAIRHRELGYYE